MPGRTSTTREPIVFAAVLAAGSSRRFGRHKLLEKVEGKPLVRQAAEIAQYADGVIVGSAFVRALLDAESAAEGVDRVRELARDLRGGVAHGSRNR